ncbi:Monoacylglycerol lipase abhd12 [Coelomomyces lativittatus]|nr:Monoacylglycerol lipase abhd12 [Coelomomyces lativittatus]
MKNSSKWISLHPPTFFPTVYQRPAILRVLVHFLLLYLSVISLLCISPWLQRQLIYLHWVNYPYVNVSEPSLFTNLKPLHASSFYIQTEDRVRLGAWHICSTSPCTLQNTSKVFLYFHGNAGHRGTHHRIQMYKELLSVAPEAHVITFDYRGYGDSDYYVPTNWTMFMDSLAMWQYLLNLGIQPHQIYFVAHSLGTGISTHLASFLPIKPSSILLFAPYTNLASAATSHPLVLAVPFLVKPFIVDHFDNHAIVSLNVPIFIVHGTWDLTIPISHSHALLTMACRSSPALEIVVSKQGLLKACPSFSFVSFFEKWESGHNLGLDGIEELIKNWFITTSSLSSR